MAVINARLYKNTFELLKLYNTSSSFRNSFQRLLNSRARIYYKGVLLKDYVKAVTSLNYRFYLYRYYKQTPEIIDSLFTNFFVDTRSRQRLEQSASQYQVTEEDKLLDRELEEIAALDEDKKKENFFDKYLKDRSGEPKGAEGEKEVKQQDRTQPTPAAGQNKPQPQTQTQMNQPNQYKQNFADRIKKLKIPNLIKNLSSKWQITARKLLSKLTTTQLTSLGLGLTGGLLGLISNGSAGALIGGAAGAITPTLINKGYGQLAVQAAYVVGIRTSRALNSLNNIKLGLPGLTLALKNPLILIIAIGAGLLLFILMPGGLLESSALLPSYTSLSTAGSSSGSGATGNLTITKTGPSAVGNGDNITYQISVSYKAGTADIEVADKLPSGTDFLSASDGGQNQSGTVKWTLTGVSSTQKTITLTVKTTQPDIYVTNTATATATVTKTSGGGGGSGKGLLCVKGLDPRLTTFFEDAGVNSNTSPALIYSVAKAENGGDVKPWSLVGALHPISPCGAHGIMQIQHINDGSGRNYGASCRDIGGTSNPPEIFDDLKRLYNAASGGKITDADDDQSSIYAGAYHLRKYEMDSMITTRAKNYNDQLTSGELSNIAASYVGAGNTGYINIMVDAYQNAFAAQGSCGTTP